jgi:hypothetical protein
MMVKTKRLTTWLASGIVTALFLTACASASAATGSAPTGPEPTEVELEEEPAEQAEEQSTEGPEAAEAETGTEGEVTIMTEDNRPAGLMAVTQGWGTNWNRHTIPYDELLSGGPPRDGIPSIDDPRFISQQAAEWLAANEPAVALEIDGDARTYPLQILTWQRDRQRRRRRCAGRRHLLPPVQLGDNL